MPTTRTRRVLLVPLLLLTCWLGSTGTAQAHTALSSSTPVEGSTVTEPLTQAVLDFNGAVRGAEVTVTGPDGAVVSTGPASTEGGTVTVPVDPTTAGAHTISWSVTSADGHDLEGTVSFDHAGPVATPVAPSPTPAPTPAPTTAPTTAVPSVSTAADDAVAALEPEVSTAGRTGTVVLVLLVALVVLGVVTAGLRRRR